MLNSYVKGYRYEHEMEKELQADFPKARFKRSGTQESNKFVSGDVVAYNPDHPFYLLHFELNHSANPKVFTKFSKAKSDAKDNRNPVVFIKKTGGDEIMVVSKRLGKQLLRSYENDYYESPNTN